MKRSLIAGLVLGSFVGASAINALAAPKKSSSRASATASASGGKVSATASGNATATASANGTSVTATGDGAADAKTPKPFEHAGHKVKLTAPGNWTPWGGSGPSDTMPFAFSIQPEPGSMRPSKKGEAVKFHGDDVIVEVSPLLDPEAKPETLVADLKESIKRTDPEAEFKSAEKIKVDGLDATALTVTLPGEDKDEPKRLERHVAFARDGKLFDVTLKSHVNTVGKQLNPFQTFVRSIKFAAPPAKGEALLKVHANEQYKMSVAAPAALTTGVPCHELACNGSFLTVIFPEDRRYVQSLFQKDDGAAPSVLALHTDGVTLAVVPPKSPAATLDAAVEDIKAEVKAAYPTTEFKPAEKTKVGDADAVVLASTSDGDAKDKEPERVQRRVVMVRDGKVYQIIHFSHADTVERQTPAFERIVSSFRFTSPEATATPVAVTPAAVAPAAAKNASKSEGDGLE
jgi:hypothetical protein